MLLTLGWVNVQPSSTPPESGQEVCNPSCTLTSHGEIWNLSGSRLHLDKLNGFSVVRPKYQYSGGARLQRGEVRRLPCWAQRSTPCPLTLLSGFPLLGSLPVVTAQLEYWCTIRPPPVSHPGLKEQAGHRPFLTLTLGEKPYYCPEAICCCSLPRPIMIFCRNLSGRHAHTWAGSIQIKSPQHLGRRVHTEQICWHEVLLSDWEIILSSTASNGFRRGENPMCRLQCGPRWLPWMNQIE